ncbi:M48 family metallopeptidase [Haliea sp. E1-2-M8]|uniref:M48 family metallopeptidase n=1 Tax=Haliea sp. E1-2-M8 TaxID=3064706 RepID=UPI002717FC8C|nr:M48 family metallopeptidase [Haliea sp. E1-2-M8]MDO8862688.1 M48 family metallopeptidase [Haliea sp. E1-2-M8]
MDFFARQDLARRNTRLLTVLFLLAVAGLILLTNAMVAAFLWWGDSYNLYAGQRGGWREFLSYFNWQRFGGIGLGVGATVAMVSLVKWLQLASGGKVVAEAMGGVRVLSQTRDRAERRCLNIVDEMALAAGMPVPPVYVMNGERGINAFAAGISPADAVIGVTRGTIAHLKRHELQGVIAHEFSHILNGDMRLNIRLAALLKGITFIGDVGYILMRSSSHHRTGNDRDRSSGGPALPLLGAGLWITGWLGGLAAGFIKSAISRQKEYLADACAVQYTRDNTGIADALKVIGGYLPGSLVHAARADEMSHIFFGQIRHQLWQLFATHPPLPQRIRRLDPQWDGQYLERQVVHYPEHPARPGAGEVGVGRAALVTAALAVTGLAREATADADADADFGPEPDQLEEATAARHKLPLAFIRYSHEPLGATALVMALLFSPDASVRKVQYALLRDSGVSGLEDLAHTLREGVAQLDPGLRLPLIELCLPALKSQSADQYQQFKRTLLGLIRADRRTDLLEWSLYQLLRHYLDPEFIQVKPATARHRSLDKVRYHLRVVLSMLAYHGSGEAAATFRLAADELGYPALQLLPVADCSLEAFARAVHQLADCYPLLKPPVLKAMSRAASADGTLSPVERELLTSLAAVMDCPLPGTLGNLSTTIP